MTGERDPLVDDTVIFAGRLRRAKEAMARAQNRPFEDSEAAEVALIPGVSHGFMQFPGIYPPAWKHFDRCVVWFEQLFLDAEHARTKNQRPALLSPRIERMTYHNQQRSHHLHHLAESSGEEDKPLDISMTKLNRGRGAPPAGGAPKAELAPNGQADSISQKHRKRILSKNKSLIKLKSTDDLLDRRMEGLAGGLTGTGEEN
jgi:hypothetical protein